MQENPRADASANVIAETLRSTIIPVLLSDKAPVSIDEGKSSGVIGRRPDKDDLVAFTDVLLNQTEDKAGRFFLQLLEDGYPVSALFDELLPGSARLLGKMWERDECSFADVTLGLTSIHRLLLRFGNRLSYEVAPVTGEPLILITPVPGENHIFAAALLAEYFRAARWHVHSGIHDDWGNINQRVREQPFDVVGITVSCGQKIPSCRRLINEVRNRSLNPDVRILVGGPPFIEDPDLHRQVGADATAIDAAEAITAASRYRSDNKPISSKV